MQSAINQARPLRKRYVSYQGNSSKVEQHLLSPERTSFCETSLSTSGLTEHGRATCADDNGLGVGENCCNGEAARALDIHEEGSRFRNQILELVLARFSSRSWIEEVYCENHYDGL